jgi:hypothetical protein
VVKKGNQMRKCRVCHNELPNEKFAVKRRPNKQGIIKEYFDTTCMVCRRSKYLEQPGKREIHRQGTKNWYRDNPDKAKSQRLKQYGLDLDGYNALRKKQKYCCAVCHKHETEVSQGRAKTTATALHVDHDHVTNKVRGLLCTNCNTILGKCYDDVKILKQAVNYLKDTL